MVFAFNCIGTQPLTTTGMNIVVEISQHKGVHFRDRHLGLLSSRSNILNINRAIPYTYIIVRDDDE